MAGNLIATAFFVSPEYLAKVDADWKFRGHGVMSHPDTTDIFHRWLSRNLFVNRGTLVGGYDLHGRNGVFCRVDTDTIETGDREKVGQSIDDFNGATAQMPYLHVVRVQYQPTTRTIPRELTAALKDHRYSKASAENPIVKKSHLSRTSG
jgi:hypothetical protein